MVLLRVRAAARGTCHVARGATWQTPSLFRRFGASFGVCYDRIGPAVLELFTKVLGHPDRLTHTQTGPAELQKSTLPRGNLHSSEWANAHCRRPIALDSFFCVFGTSRAGDSRLRQAASPSLLSPGGADRPRPRRRHPATVTWGGFSERVRAARASAAAVIAHVNGISAVTVGEPPPRRRAESMCGRWVVHRRTLRRARSPPSWRLAMADSDCIRTRTPPKRRRVMGGQHVTIVCSSRDVIDAVEQNWSRFRSGLILLPTDQSSARVRWRSLCRVCVSWESPSTWWVNYLYEAGNTWAFV